MLDFGDLVRREVLNLLNQSVRRDAHIESFLSDVEYYQNIKQSMKRTLIISGTNHVDSQPGFEPMISSISSRAFSTRASLRASILRRSNGSVLDDRILKRQLSVCSE